MREHKTTYDNKKHGLQG